MLKATHIFFLEHSVNECPFVCGEDAESIEGYLPSLVGGIRPPKCFHFTYIQVIELLTPTIQPDISCLDFYLEKLRTTCLSDCVHPRNRQYRMTISWTVFGCAGWMCKSQN